MERDLILQKAIEYLKTNDHVHLILEGGSKAFNRFDDLSDIDLMVGVEDDKVEETIQQFEDFLNELTGIETTYIATANKGFHHRFYKLKNTDKYAIVDLYIIEHSVENKEMEKEIHGDFVIYHDRFDYMMKQAFDQRTFSDKVAAYREKMKNTFEFFQFLVEKEIARKRYIDAFGFYLDFTVKPLIRLLRIKYNPVHYNFEMRYLYDELPQNIIDELETLLSIRDMNDLKNKHERAFQLYRREIG